MKLHFYFFAAAIFLFMFFYTATAQITNLDSGLVAFYPFTGNANDESINGNNGIITNAILSADRFNQNERAVYFNGTDARIEIPHNNSLNINNDISISVWIKPEEIQTSGNRMIVGKSNYFNATNYIFRVTPNAVLQWEYFTSLYSNSNSLTADSWYHLVLTADSTTGIKQIYINGNLILDQLVPGSGPFGLVTDPLTIGAAKHFGSAWAEFFKGTIDDIRIYNRILDSTEVAALFQDSTTYSGDSLIAYFPFNGNALDATGNGYDGTINGNASLVPDRFGSQNKAVTFPDQSSSISIANSTNLNLENGFTLNAWIKYKSGATKVIICKHVCGYVNGFIFWIDTDGQIKLLLGQSGWSIVGTNQTFVEDQWYMVTATYDAGTSTAKVYVDGQNGGTGSVAYNNYSTNPISIGESYQNNCVAGNMDGAVDEVKIYNRALSDAEILYEYNNTYNDLVLFLPFNGNANDESGSGNNGTVNGASLTQDRFGVNNRAYQFDGLNDFISIADNPNLFSDELTISWWYKMTEILGGERVVIGWVDGGHRYQQFFNGGQLSYLNGYNVSQFGMYFNPIYGLNDLNVWKNVVVTYQKTGESTSTTSLYIDGELKQTDSHFLAMDYVPGIDLFIGKNHNGAFFKGYLDDFRIYNRILNNDEILALYNDSTTYFPPIEDGLAAYWPFDGNTMDSTYNNNDGINHNGVFSFDRFANENRSIYFDGIDSYVEGLNPGNNLPAGNSPRTISVWIKSLEASNDRNVFHYGYDIPSNTNYHLLLTSGRYAAIGNGWGFGLLYTDNDIGDTTWHFLTAVYEGNSTNLHKIYIDGKLDTVGIISNEPNTFLTTNWKIGRFMGGGQSLLGYLDDLKVYDIALSDYQIWDMYKAGTTAPALLSPANDSTIVNPLNLVLDWDSAVTAISYRLIIANDSLFTTTFLDTIITVSSFSADGVSFPNVDYIYWKVRTINEGGIGPWSEFSRFSVLLSDVEDEKKIPTEFALIQNYPNPFNPSTRIQYQVSSIVQVKLKVYDILGNEIATLVNEEKSPGIYEVEFNSSEHNLSSGVYLYKLNAGDFISVKKLILIK